MAKLKVLFVDDEPQLLRLLQMTLQAMPEWEPAFATSGDQALALLEQTPFDAVISDMRMPGMSGAQLLNETMKRYPKTFRIILSGYSDEDVLLNYIGSTHQYLSKPFTIDKLRSTLESLSQLNQSLVSPEFQRMLAQITTLPAIPKIYFTLIDALQDINCSTQTIASIIAEDPGMTAKMLQLVNSAFFGFSGRVNHPAEAVRLLGTARIRALVLSLSVFSAFDPKKFTALSIDAIWNHSLNTGLAAQKIASMETDDDTTQDQAFTAGLLHDTGKLILAENLPGPYLEIIKTARQQQRPIADIEREQLGVTHAELGAYLFSLWALPSPLVSAIAWHHSPAQDKTPGFTPLTAVHVANSLFSLEKTLHIPAFPIDAAYLQQIGLAQRLEVWKTELHTSNKTRAK